MLRIAGGICGMLAVAALGCAPLPQGSNPFGPQRIGSAIVVRGAELSPNGTGLLGALRGRIAAMRVERGVEQCPTVRMRGAKTGTGSRSALVYVDGSPVADTCILDQLRVAEVERVELYPGGQSARPGYRAHPNGLILVFLVGAGRP